MAKFYVPKGDLPPAIGGRRMLQLVSSDAPSQHCNTGGGVLITQAGRLDPDDGRRGRRERGSRGGETAARCLHAVRMMSVLTVRSVRVNESYSAEMSTSPSYSGVPGFESVPKQR
jgi:hypothetical protein